MANTYVVVNIETDQRLAVYRAYDLPTAHELAAQFDGPLGVYDLTDGMRAVGYVVTDADGSVRLDPNGIARKAEPPARRITLAETEQYQSILIALGRLNASVMLDADQFAIDHLKQIDHDLWELLEMVEEGTL